MIYKLVLKDYCSKVDSDEKDFNERFYRYDIVDLEDKHYATVWFGQMVNSKNIYTVSVSLDMKYNEKFNLYINCPSNEYYPKEYEVVSYQKSVSNALIQTNNIALQIQKNGYVEKRRKRRRRAY